MKRKSADSSPDESRELLAARAKKPLIWLAKHVLKSDVGDPKVAEKLAETIVEMGFARADQRRELVRQLWQHLGERKFRLLLAACCRHALQARLRPGDYAEPLDVLEEFADTGIGKTALRGFRRKNTWNTGYPELGALYQAISMTEPEQALISAISAMQKAFKVYEQKALDQLHQSRRDHPSHSPEPSDLACDRRALDQLHRFHHDLVSRLPDPDDFAGAWRSSAVVDLARTIYQSRDFSTMGRLADALEEAGCKREAVLDHCREPGATHIRGCWVLDAILGDWIAKRRERRKKKPKTIGKGPLQLSEIEFKAVEDFMNDENNRAYLTLEELIERRFRLDLSETYKDIARPRPTWTDEQIHALILFGEISGDGVRLCDTAKRGIARRIALNSPKELAMALAVGARYAWLNDGHKCTDDVSNNSAILLAIAAHDFAVAQRFADTALAVIEEGKVRKYDPLYVGIIAMFTGDATLLARCVDKAPKSGQAWFRGTREALQGAAEGSPSLVATGLDRLLRAVLRNTDDDDVGRLVDPYSHGVYELCLRWSPDIVSEFDVTRGKPWDAEYHAWLRANENPLERLDLNGISPEVHRAVVELQRPIWWDAKQELEWPDRYRVLFRFPPRGMSEEELVAIHKCLPRFRERPLTEAVRAGIRRAAFEKDGSTWYVAGLLFEDMARPLYESARALGLDAVVEKE